MFVLIEKYSPSLIQNIHFETYFYAVMKKKIVFKIIISSSVNKNMCLSSFFLTYCPYSCQCSKYHLRI